MVSMTVLPCDSGRPITKSIAMCDYRRWGMGSGCRSWVAPFSPSSDRAGRDELHYVSADPGPPKPKGLGCDECLGDRQGWPSEPTVGPLARPGWEQRSSWQECWWDWPDLPMPSPLSPWSPGEWQRSWFWRVRWCLLPQNSVEMGEGMTGHPVSRS